MHPLSPWTYYVRHKKSALVQIALISLATVGLFVLVGVLDAIPLRANVIDLTKLSRVFPAGSTLDAAVVAHIQAHPGVQRVIPDNGLSISLPTLLGLDSQRLLGVSPEEAQYLLDYCGLHFKEGRMFAPRSNEFVLSEEVARALKLRIGDAIGREVDKTYYGAVSAPLVLVGTLEGAGSEPGVRLGFVSGEYLRSHELYAPRSTGLLVLAAPEHKAAVDEFLETTVNTQYADVETWAGEARFVNMARIGVWVIFGIVNSVVAVVVAAVVGVINQIALAGRLSELGLLHALGHQKPRLVRRIALETAVVAGIGTLIGLGLALLALTAIKNSLFYNLGMELNLFDPAPFLFVLPIPAIVIALNWHSVRRTFARLDAVAIVERGHLSEEPQQRPSRKLAASGNRPLSSPTFYLRHRRRGVLTILSTALMVLATTFPVFLLSAATDAMLPFLGNLQYISEVIPVQSELGPGVVAQIRQHPAVQQAISAISLGVQMVVPPGGATSVSVYGVSEADLPTLIDAFGLQVQEGRLPRPRSNEIVLSAAIVANRNLRVGDVIGGEVDSGNALVSDDLPTEMVVVGILTPDRPWVGLASYEYLHSHEIVSARTPRLLLVPQQGRKEEMDRWLEENVATNQIGIATYAIRTREYRKAMASISLTFALLECMIAAIAAVAVATLNTIFFIQRQEEFGVLNAIGRSRSWLTWRAMKETGSAASIAWIAGAALCGIVLLGMQALFYAPRGLSLDFLNPIPWIFTVPLPLSVILASVVTVARMLRKLDPVTVIERR